MKSATEIVLPHATTPTIAPPTPSTARQLPAMLFARMSTSQAAAIAMVVVHLAAIALTTTIALPFAKII